MQPDGRELVDLLLPESCRAGSYVTPAAYEIDSLGVLDKRGVRPHIARRALRARSLDKVVAAINASGYGLTLGLHSRIEAVGDYVAEHARVGNIYVNRNQIGAVVGVQPFGGEGCRAPAPRPVAPIPVAYATERVRSTDMTATGGNLELLTAATITGR